MISLRIDAVSRVSCFACLNEGAHVGVNQHRTTDRVSRCIAWYPMRLRHVEEGSYRRVSDELLCVCRIAT